MEEDEEKNKSNLDEYLPNEDTNGSIGNLSEAVDALEDEEGNENNYNDYLSYDESGVKYIDSENKDATKMNQLMNTFCKGHYDDEIEDAKGRGRDDDHPLVNTCSNKPTDCLERNAIGLENKAIQSLNLVEDGKSVGLFLLHNIPQRFQEECVVWHDPSIDPYWEQLVTAFQNLTNDDSWFDRICTANVEMSIETAAALVVSLSGRAINTIHTNEFENVNHCREGIVLLSSLFEQSLELLTLNLSCN